MTLGGKRGIISFHNR